MPDLLDLPLTPDNPVVKLLDRMFFPSGKDKASGRQTVKRQALDLLDSYLDTHHSGVEMLRVAPVRALPGVRSKRDQELLDRCERAMAETRRLLAAEHARAAAEPPLLPFLLRGLAVPTSTLAGDGRGEVFAFFAFREHLLAGRTTRLLYEHNAANVLATTQDGTLRLSEQSDGIYFSARLPDTDLGRKVLAEVRQGLLGMSAGYRATETKRRYADGQHYDSIRTAALPEISLVSCPAFSETWVTWHLLD